MSMFLRRQIFFISTFLTLLFLLSPLPLFAKKGDSKKTSSLNYKDLPPSRKLSLLGSLLLSGRLQEAWNYFLESSKLKLDARSKNRLSFIQGYLFLSQGKPKEAAQIFETLKDQYPEIEPILPYWLARAQRLAGEGRKALGILEKYCQGPCVAISPEGTVNPQITTRVGREYASALCEAGDHDRALEMLGQLLTQSTRELDREWARLDLIDCQMKKGDFETAYSELKRSFIYAPGGLSKKLFTESLAALHRIHSKIPSEFSLEDQFSRISSLRLQERWLDAAQELKDLWPKLDAATQNQKSYEAAETFFKARLYREAAEIYEKILKNTTDPIDQVANLEKLGQAYARSNQFDKAIQIQKEIEASSEKDAQKASYKIAFLFADAGQCDKAIQAFQDFLDRYPQSSKREEARWQLAWCLHQVGKFDEALAELEVLEKIYPKRVAYWRMRFAEEAGKKEIFNANREAFEEKAGESFYAGWRRFSQKTDKNQCPRVNTFQLILKQENPSMSALFADRDAKEQQTLQELLHLGLWEDFLDRYHRQNEGDEFSFREGSSVLSQWVNFFSDAEQIPRELVWAVMREESHFNPKARSPAGALGLMQIIPQTGYEIAEDLKLSSYSTEDLSNPLINLRFGTYYLSKLLRKFSGNVIYAIAAYNAGPAAVDRWSEQRIRHRCDEFIEEIPYRETYNYVMKVMQSLWNYGSHPSHFYQASSEN